MKSKFNTSFALNVISKVFFYALLLVIISLILIQLKPVQTYLAKKFVSEILYDTDYEMSVGGLKISWLDRATLQEVLVLDKHKDTIIHANSLEVNYKIWDLFTGKYSSVEEVNADDLTIKIIKQKGGDGYEVEGFFSSFALESDGGNSDSTNATFVLEQGILNNVRVIVEDRNKTKKSGFDENYLDIRIPSLDLADLKIKGEDITGRLLHFSATDQYSDFSIKKFNTVFELNSYSLLMTKLDLDTEYSHIGDSVSLYYNGYDDYSYFLDSITFAINFNDTKVSSKDINFFVGQNVLDTDISIDGIFWGGFSDFNLEKARIGLGDKTYIKGGVSCFGLPNLSKTFLLADVNQSKIYFEDFKSYLKGDFYDRLDYLKHFDFKGSYAGFLKDFVAKGIFESDYGTLVTDINLKIPDDIYKSTYKGHIELKQVDLGDILKEKNIGKVNLNGEIKGKGLKKTNAVFDLKALFTDSELKNYRYDSISVDGKFSNLFFDGNYQIKDPNCKIKGVAQVDLNSKKNILNVKAKASKLQMDSLNWVNQPVSVSGNLDVNLKSFILDEMTGGISIDSGIAHFNNRHIAIDSIVLKSKIANDSSRFISIVMPGVSCDITGKFNLTDIANDIPSILNDYAYQLNLTSDSVKSFHNVKKHYKAQLNAKIGDISYLLDSLKVPLRFTNGADLEINYRRSKSTNLSVYVASDTVYYGKSKFVKPIVELASSKEISTRDVLTSFLVEVKEQTFKGVPDILATHLEGVWDKDQINLNLYATQPETSSMLDIQGVAQVTKNFLRFKFNPSKIVLLNEEWDFDKRNQLYVNPHVSKVDYLGIQRGDEYLGVNGVYSDSLVSFLKVKSNHLDLNKINLFTTTKFAGELDTDIEIFKQRRNATVKNHGKFYLKNFAVDSILIGNILGKSDWNAEKQQMSFLFELDNQNQSTIKLEGTYSPDKKENPLNLKAVLRDQKLNFLNIFLSDIFSDFDGGASGVVTASGSLSSPVLRGELDVKKGFLNFGYLNTNYDFEGKVLLTDKIIDFQNFTLTDRKGSKANLSGNISHKLFDNFNTNLVMNAKEFEVLNTLREDNSLYYGTAYTSGIVNIQGPFEDLLIKSTLTTDKNTRFYIPVEPDKNSEQLDFIKFVNFKDTLNINKEAEKEVFHSLITLDFDLTITPDAYCEIIFDPKTGDIIRGRGSGNLKFRMDKDSELNMFGGLTINEGAYNFVVPGLLSKEFKIKKDSRISWFGDPYNAVIDIEATYNQRASFEQLESVENQDASLLSEKETIVVVLFIKGEATSPNITFDLTTSQGAIGINSTQLAQIKSDEQELRRQVISLLFLKKFSPRRSFAIAQASVGRSVSEFFSSQVSQLLSQIDENLEVEVDLSALDDDAFNTLQLRLAYTFLDGRLKVARGGGIGANVGENSQRLNNLIGDWSVEYTLTRNGKLRMKAFSNSRNDFISSNKFSQETGIGLLFIHSFNNFKDLIFFTRDRFREKNK